MPASSKRPQRARREVVKATIIPDSSPSRPAKRRKKVNNDGLAQLNEPAPSKKVEDSCAEVDESVENLEIEATKLPSDRAGIPMNDEELISVIVPTLLLPSHMVQATIDHANALHEKHSKQGVQAYAKLAGRDWTFYVKRLKNNIGRPPEGSNYTRPAPEPDGVVDESYHDDTTVHVDLGPSKTISRTHAEILFDPDTESWNILVHGRNGIKVNNKMLKRGSSTSLVSGEVIEIDGVEMMFVLPQEDGCLKIDNYYLHRARLISTPKEEVGTKIKEEEIEQDSEENLKKIEQGSIGGTFGKEGKKVLGTEKRKEEVQDDKSTPTFSPRGYVGPTNGSPKSNSLLIAPAPPDYKRPGTPVNIKNKGVPYLPCKSTPGALAGNTMFMNNDDIDLSRDSNHHIKPSYSYSQLISQAILDTHDEKLTLNGIYNFIMEKYAYYRHQLGGGWQNSIRHNLSLNKAFEKVARDSNEPGKGMKWHIKDDHRDEMARLALRGGRGGHRGSPGSPGVLSRNSRSTCNPSSRRQKRSPGLGSPLLNLFPSNSSQFTPDRGMKLTEALHDELPGDGSPLPRHCRSYGLSDNIPGSPPVLSSSYMAEDNTSFVTPAPHRVHPRLAPPSTAQRPSQHMPTSSPAPFWKYAGIGNTPMRGASFDSSPVKGQSRKIPACSSSPAPEGSPTKNTSGRNMVLDSVQTIDDEIDDDQGIDLTRGFQSIGSYHAPITIGVSVGTPISRR